MTDNMRLGKEEEEVLCHEGNDNDNEDDDIDNDGLS